MFFDKNISLQNVLKLRKNKMEIEKLDVYITQLSHGVTVGGELDYLDDGTISAALSSRRPF